MFDVLNFHQRCIGCFNRTALIRAAYHPGFTENRTSWRACLFDDNILAETVRWHSSTARRIETEFRGIEQSIASDLCSLATEISILFDPDEGEIVLDASTIELDLVRLDRGFIVPVGIGYLEANALNANELIAYESFRATWFALRKFLPIDYNPYAD